MRTVGLKLLKNELNEHVRLAAAGEMVVVNDRGRVVAALVPPRPSRSRSSERGIRGARLDHTGGARIRLATARQSCPAHLRATDGRPRSPPRRSVIYVDSSIALSRLLF